MMLLKGLFGTRRVLREPLWAHKAPQKGLLGPWATPDSIWKGKTRRNLKVLFFEHFTTFWSKNRTMSLCCCPKASSWSHSVQIWSILGPQKEGGGPPGTHPYPIEFLFASESISDPVLEPKRAHDARFWSLQGPNWRVFEYTWLVFVHVVWTNLVLIYVYMYTHTLTPQYVCVYIYIYTHMCICK